MLLSLPVVMACRVTQYPSSEILSIEEGEHTEGNGTARQLAGWALKGS